MARKRKHQRLGPHAAVGAVDQHTHRINEHKSETMETEPTSRLEDSQTFFTTLATSSETGKQRGFFKPIRKIVAVLLVVFLCTAISRIILGLDLDKRVFNHKPGVCRSIGNLENGTSYMEFVPKLNVLFVTQSGADTLMFASRNNGSSSPKNTHSAFGRVLAVPFPEQPVNVKVEKLSAEPLAIDISSSSTPEDFNRQYFTPLGVSVVMLKARAILYIVNARGGAAGKKSTIEVFSYLPKKGQRLSHLKTIQSDAFQSLTDIAVIENTGERFVAVNAFYFKNPVLQAAEVLLQSRSGNMVFYDGKKATTIDSEIAMPTAVTFDPERRYLYVASFTGKVIKTFTVSRDLAIVSLSEIAIMSAPYHLTVEQSSGDLWTTAHPVLHRSLRSVVFPDSPISKCIGNLADWWTTEGKSINKNSTKAIIEKTKEMQKTPSHVLRIRFQDERSSWVITEPLANDGGGIGAATGLALVQNDRLVIGGFRGKSVLCAINDIRLA